MSAHAEQDRRLSAAIRHIFEAHAERYGSPRVHRVLTRLAKVRGLDALTQHCARDVELGRTSPWPQGTVSRSVARLLR
jgi:hypothetical protein